MKPRIAYGVHGYGRGHATRARAVLPALLERYEVLVLAGDEAYDFLSGDFPCVRIPTIRYVSGRDGKRSTLGTLRRNVPAFLDVAWRGPIAEFVRREVERHAAEVVVSDSEAWTHRAAIDLGLPRVGFDHYGILLHCRLGLSARERALVRVESVVYRWIAPDADRTIVAAFFDGEPRTPGVRVVGPILRPEVHECESTPGDHLLVYFQPRTVRVMEAVLDSLRDLPVPARVYGPGSREPEANLEFRPIGNRSFLRDLASCRAVVSTAGNQLISEAIHYGKPLLVLPEEALEQRLNGRFVEQWAIGEWTTPGRLSPDRLRRFLDRTAEYAARIPERRRDGLAGAVAALTEAIETLREKAP